MHRPLLFQARPRLWQLDPSVAWGPCGMVTAANIGICPVLDRLLGADYYVALFWGVVPHPTDTVYTLRILCQVPPPGVEPGHPGLEDRALHSVSRDKKDRFFAVPQAVLLICLGYC